jgi:hypothetical protein
VLSFFDLDHLRHPLFLPAPPCGTALLRAIASVVEVKVQRHDARMLLCTDPVCIAPDEGVIASFPVAT